MIDKEPQRRSLSDLIAQSRNLRASSMLWLCLVKETAQTLEHLRDKEYCPAESSMGTLFYQARISHSPLRPSGREREITRHKPYLFRFLP